MIDNTSMSERRGFSAATLLGVAVIAALLGVGAMKLFGGGGAAPPEKEKEEAHEKLPPGVVEVPEAAQKNAAVQVVAAVQQTLPTRLQVTGVVAPEDSRVAHVRPLAKGVIEEIAVKLGDRVTKGQTLLSYDNIEMGQLVGEYLSAKAAERQAQADLEVRQQALQRGEQLIKLEAVAQQTVELRRAEARNAEAALASQRAGVSKIEEQLHRFGLSDTDLARLTPDEGRSAHRNASHAALRAPVSGVVTKYEVASGELVEPDRELFTITDLSTVWVLADVYEKDLSKVANGTDVEVRVDTYPDRVFKGRLSYISIAIDPKTRTAKVRCVVPNPDGALKMDMFARVSIPTGEQRRAVTVPVDAVQQVDAQSVVFEQESPTRFIRRDVQTGDTAGGQIEIIKGLGPGAKVVAAGSFYLKTALLKSRIGDEH